MSDLDRTARPTPAEPDSSDGAALITAERRRQVAAEGWTAEHDDGHSNDQLARAAACYALPAHVRQETTSIRPPSGYADAARPTPRLWPWAPRYWKPRPDDRVRELVKAGALIAAEIDRLSDAQPGPDAEQAGGEHRG